MQWKYRKLCNEVRSSARKDKQKWLEKQCEDIEQYAGEYKTREVFKMIKSINRKWQPRLMAIRDRHGNILMDKEKMKEGWTEYCKDLYSETEQTDIILLKELRDISPPDEDDERDVILYEEVERAVIHLKKKSWNRWSSRRNDKSWRGRDDKSNSRNMQTSVARRNSTRGMDKIHTHNNTEKRRCKTMKEL